MATKYPFLYRGIQAIAISFALAGYMIPDILLRWESVLAISLIALIGIPHGATDHLIFRNLVSPFLGTRRMIYFYCYYLLLIGLYALLWWVLPIFSLLVFLVLSAYHFGQSNWNYIPFSSKIISGIYYLCWGAFVITVPILVNYESTVPIISGIIRQAPPSLSFSFCMTVVCSLLFLNLVMSFILWADKKISVRQFFEESLSLIVLTVVFFYTPVLLGFALYFVCWHSMSSVMDQIQFFKERKRRYSLKKYLRDTLPFTVLALSSLGLMLWIQNEFLGSMQVGLLFIFISIVTLPHMILIDRLYNDLQQLKE